MDIKLKATLAAYARVDTLNVNHSCDLMSPVTSDQIDQLFPMSGNDSEIVEPTTDGKAFIDSLFEGE